MLTLTVRVILPCALAMLLTACVSGGSWPGYQAAPAAQPAEPPLPPGSPAALAQAQKLAAGAVDLLESGQEEQAKTDLQRALTLDSGNKLATNLMRQITAPDPVAALGRESFTYVVRPSDTLSRIAGRFLGDIYSFYILARYNDIKVPRQVAGGQTLRIPGKAPAPGALEPRDPSRNTMPSAGNPDNKAVMAAPLPTPPAPPPPPEPTAAERAMQSAAAAERAGNFDRALEEYRRAAAQQQPGAAAKAEDVRKRLIGRHTLAARTAFAKQDLTGSIRAWDRVLELEPSNEIAKLERQKAVMLKQKVDGLK